jgi:uncharacterized protein (DUF1800 family)
MVLRRGGTSSGVRAIAAAAMLSLAVAALPAFAQPAPKAGPAEPQLTGKEQAEKEKAIAVHVLTRTTFGARPGMTNKVIEKGWKKWVEEQLEPEKIEEKAFDERFQKEYPSWFMTLSQAQDKYRPEYAMMEGSSKEQQKKRDELRREIQHQLQHGVIDRAVNSERQLYEVVCEFWRNHFSVDQNKDELVYLAPHWEANVIRRHAMGRFQDMLVASAHHPAMLIYLDNEVSQRPLTPTEEQQLARYDPASGRGKPRYIRRLERHRGLNENYARELMELHTLGVDNVYTQADVTDVARVLTGWSVDRSSKGDYGFAFKEELNDRLPKYILGVRLTGVGGKSDGDLVIDGLAKHPGTAKFIATKLCRYFVNDEPPPQLVNRVAQVFRSTGGDLKKVYREILTSQEFLNPEHRGAKFKTPLEFTLSAIRMTGATVEDPKPLLRALERMGQAIYECEDPTGYYDVAESWCDPGVMIHRWHFALKLADNKLEGVKLPENFYDQFDKMSGKDVKAKLVQQLLPGGVDPKTDAIFDKHASRGDGKQAARHLLGLILGSPAFQQQ